MWRAVCASVRGTSHVANGLPCQDSCRIEPFDSHSGIYLCALSDGAGSAKYADVGSRFLVDEALAFLRARLIENPDHLTTIRLLTKDDGVAFLTGVRERLSQIGAASSAKLEDYNATLLCAVIHPECSVFYQIGDGCWVVGKNGIYCSMTLPTRGEFVGQTIFATSRSYADDLQFERADTTLDSVTGFTDGIERLVLHEPGFAPNARFFEPFVKSLRKSTDIEAFERELSDFLESEKISAKTDDDKTLAIIAGDCI